MAPRMEARCDGTAPIPTSRRLLGTETRTIGRWCGAWAIYLHPVEGQLALGSGIAAALGAEIPGSVDKHASQRR
jgi:hypothetical protein